MTAPQAAETYQNWSHYSSVNKFCLQIANPLRNPFWKTLVNVFLTLVIEFTLRQAGFFRVIKSGGAGGGSFSVRVTKTVPELRKIVSLSCTFVHNSLLPPATRISLPWGHLCMTSSHTWRLHISIYWNPPVFSCIVFENRETMAIF